MKTDKNGGLKKACIGLAAASVLAVAGCSNVSEYRISEEFTFCWEVLSYFFIYQDSLPEDPYGYANNTAMLYESVNEPFTQYIPPASAQEYLGRLTTSTVGIGIILDSVSGGLLIQWLFDNSPGSRAGLARGDTIIIVNGDSLAGKTFSASVELIRGNEGDRRNLTVKRGGSIEHITVILAEYLAPSVLTDSVDTNIAYIALLQFANETNTEGGSAAEMRSALVHSAWARYTILDLRGNGGGYLDQCYYITSEFIPINTDIIRIHERTVDSSFYHGQWEYYLVERDQVEKSSGPGTALGRTFYVLVDTGTASASEVLVSAIMENRSDITVVGGHTYGKGRGQSMWVTPEQALAKVTRMLIFPLKMPVYDLVGITPHRLISPDEDAYEVALSMIASGGAAKQAMRQSAVRRAGRLRSEYMPFMREPLAIDRIR